MNRDDLYWLAEADYEDGTWIRRMFSYRPAEREDDQAFKIEEWLMNRHDGIAWYSVTLHGD